MLDSTCFPTPLLSSRFSPDFSLNRTQKLLAAPCIAGLLPASVPLRSQIVVEKPLTRSEILSRLSLMRSREAMQEEIQEMVREALAVLKAVRA